MLFRPSAALPKLPSIPDTVSLVDFIFDDEYGRCPLTESLDPYVDGTSGPSISAVAQKQRVNLLARALQEELGWQVNQGEDLEKVVGIFALNNVCPHNHTQTGENGGVGSTCCCDASMEVLNEG